MEGSQMDMKKRIINKFKRIRKMQEERKKKSTWEEKRNSMMIFDMLNKQEAIRQDKDINSVSTIARLDRLKAMNLTKPVLKPKALTHKKWKIKQVLVGHSGWVRCLDFDPSNEFFASGSTDNTIRFWDFATGTLKLTLTGHVSSVRAVKISHQHTYLFSASEDKSVRCWDLTTNKAIRKYHGHLGGVYCLSIHPSQNLIATGGRDAAVRLWDIRTRHEVFRFDDHTDSVNAVIMQNDEPQLYSASSDKTVKLWDIRTGKKIKGLTHHQKGIRAMVGHPVEYSFMSAGIDALKVFKFPEGGFIRNIESTDDIGIVNAVDINDDGVLVAGTDSGNLAFWDWRSGERFQLEETIPQPGSLEAEKGIYDVKFDHSSLRLLIAECDKTIKIWHQIES